MLHSDAHVIIQGELVTVEHVWPWEAIGLHSALTASSDSLTQAATGVDRAFQTDRSKEGAEEELGIRVAAEVKQGYPVPCLLLGLLQGVVFQ